MQPAWVVVDRAINYKNKIIFVVLSEAVDFPRESNVNVWVVNNLPSW